MIVITKGIFITEEELQRILDLIGNIDVEIGSTITYPNDLKKVMSNMRRANYCLFEIRNTLEDIIEHNED